MMRISGIIRLSAALLLLSTTAGLAQITGTMSGRVVDDEGRPIVGAVVRIEGTRIGGLTRFPDGHFCIQHVVAADYQYTVSGIGLRPLTKTVRIVVNQIVDVGVVVLRSSPVSIGCFGGSRVSRGVQMTRVIGRETLQDGRADGYRDEMR